MEDEKLLRKLYLEDGLSMRDIAKRINMSYSGVRHRMKKYKIPLRTDREGMNTPNSKRKRMGMLSLFSHTMGN